MGDRSLKVGELASRTGLSVRALHHYEEIGLLAPSGRTANGHRVYRAPEIARLQQIQSLRQLGLPLDEIRRVLDDEGRPLLDVLEAHRAALTEKADRVRTLLETLTQLTEHLRRSETISTEVLLRSIEQTIMVEKYYTEEQREYLRERAEAVGPERIQQVQEEWRLLFEELARAKAKGLAADSEPVLVLARKARDLIAEFTGGHEGVERSLGTMYRTEGGENVLSRQGYDLEPGAFEFLGEAREALARSERRT